ncbi:MAG: bifunctional diaminohydroxyphosphoribosylaminopyrimidine deaminase/5-amino-6-(5-phosphoribosylamino)uracil reductase RibD [Gemmatimonadetes bacterium]|nr:bifunctional diaminohydroxyphosphoribosylaminopyrimidine deaminase/5-amino-6-(5-phosphoribosylamino)uracil reductase RibD [Gemmatimonadota bacterium]
MADDIRHMQRALALAARGAGQVAPNPKVGAVVVRDGAVVGEGWHTRYGAPHAEVEALRVAGEAAHGATLYVSLEPCAHHGKTPPCTDAILAAGVARVVYAAADPHHVAAGGAALLAAAGVAVTGGVCAPEAAELNAPFLHAARGARVPFVTVKLALSLDGALVDASRQRGWLTGAEARTAVHALRAEADAIAVGIGTALADDPALTVREVPPPRVAPLRVVFDREARLPRGSTLVRTAREVPVTVITAGRNPTAEQALRQAGVDVLAVSDGPTALRDALEALRDRGVAHLLAEGGAGLASALVDAGLVHRLITFQAPVILGAGALPAFGALPARTANTAPRLRVVERRAFGADLMTVYAVSGD